MGKIRTRVIGLEDVEKEQKKEAKKRAQEKKLKKTKDVVAEEKVEQPVAASTEQTAKPAKKKEKAREEKTNVRGKKYTKASKAIDKEKFYSVKDAVELLKKIKFASFEESVELHINVIETGLKGEVEFPHSTGKTLRIKIADDKVLESLEKGVIDFDILISHPSFMVRLAKYARVLGPKGLMPNPKAGTVSPQPEEVAKKFEKGTLRWKTEPKFPIIHQLISKISAEDKAIVENVLSFMQSVGKKNMKNAFIKSTMSPSLKLNLEEII